MRDVSALAFVAVAGSFALFGCAGTYVYRPAENMTATVGQHAAAKYSVPPTNPQGDVRIASYGIVKVRPTPQTAQPAAPPPEGGEENLVRAMHVRMVVANNSNAPWFVDAREQFAIYKDTSDAKVPAAWAQVREGTVPVVTVPPSGERTIDLFFPLPAGEAEEKHLPEFDVLWHVRTPERVVAERTPFDRLRVDAYYASSYWGPTFYGWGPYGWYDPFWGPAFIGPPGWYY